LLLAALHARGTKLLLAPDRIRRQGTTAAASAAASRAAAAAGCQGHTSTPDGVQHEPPCPHAWTRARRRHTHAHTRAHKQTETQIHTHTHTHTQAHTHAHMHARTHARTRARTHTLTRNLIHAPAYTYAEPHAHTHTGGEDEVSLAKAPKPQNRLHILEGKGRSNRAWNVHMPHAACNNATSRMQHSARNVQLATYCMQQATNLRTVTRATSPRATSHVASRAGGAKYRGDGRPVLPRPRGSAYKARCCRGGKGADSRP
jgi:hypothetical protein